MSTPLRRPLEPRFEWRCWLAERSAALAAPQAQPGPQLQLHEGGSPAETGLRTTPSSHTSQSSEEVGEG